MSVLKASVIVPTYRYPGVVDCLEVLSRQNYTDYEVIVVDDGSCDESVGIVKNFVKGKKKFRFIVFDKNRGPAAVRNAGVKKAKGDVVLFTDSDCKPCMDWVSKMMKPFSDSSVAGVSGTYRTWNDESVVARFVGYEIALRHERMAKRKKIDFIGTFCAGYRRSVFLAEGGFDEKFSIASGEDTEFSYRFASKGHKMIFVKDVWVYHRHPDSVWRYMKQKFWRGFWRVRLYRKHTKKVKGESYTPFNVLVQIPLFFVFVATAVVSPFIDIIGYALSVAIALVIILLNILEGARMMKYEKSMICVAPMLLSARTVASGLGVALGFIRRKF